MSAREAILSAFATHQTNRTPVRGKQRGRGVVLTPEIPVRAGHLAFIEASEELCTALGPCVCGYTGSGRGEDRFPGYSRMYSANANAEAHPGSAAARPSFKLSRCTRSGVSIWAGLFRPKGRGFQPFFAYDRVCDCSSPLRLRSERASRMALTCPACSPSGTRAQAPAEGATELPHANRSNVPSSRGAGAPWLSRSRALTSSWSSHRCRGVFRRAHARRSSGGA